MKNISILSLLVLLSLSAMAKNEELPASYTLDTVLKSTKHCPQKITLEKKSGNIEMLVSKGDFSEGTSYGELKKYADGTIEKKKIKSIVEVSSKLITVNKFKRNKLIYKEVLIKKGQGLIWQIDNKKSRKKSMTCIYN